MLRFVQNYDGYNCIFSIKLKGLSLSFILWVIQGNLNVININVSNKILFLPQIAFLKLLNMHNFDTYFHPLRIIVLKLFDDKSKAKACKILTQSYQLDLYSRSSCGKYELLWRTKCNVDNRDVANHNFSLSFKNEKSEYKSLSAKMFVIKLVTVNVILCWRGFPFEEDCYPETLTFFRCPSFVTWLTKFQSSITSLKVN